MDYDKHKKILLIDNYDSFTFNLYQAFLVLGIRVSVIRNDSEELHNRFISDFDFIVISPGPGRPDDSGRSIKIIEMFTGVTPILGVCLGMQCINEAFGGRTIQAPVPVHGKTSDIYHSNTGLFKDISNPFQAARYHSLIIEPAKEINITSETDNNIPMSIEVAGKNVWGVQFHPESVLTPEGEKILSNFLGYNDA